MANVRTWQWLSAILLVLLVLVSALAIAHYQAASTVQAKLDCALPWLEKAMELHDLHLKDPTTTTDESQLELMDQIMKANECVTENRA